MRLFYIFVLIIVSYSIEAQRYTVSGQVIDGSGETMIGATVTLLNPADSVLVAFGTTDLNGLFKMTNVKKSSYLFQITYIGFGTVERIINVEGEEKIFDLGKIVLGQQGKMLDEIVIAAEYVPIKITKDTIEFNADAFKTQPNALVEDLLKRLPGVEVDANGGITVQGEEVKRITVDGKDFFGTDPKMATRNLPADAVKKVQVFDKKSKTAEFTGIDDGNEEKTINLELRENKKTGNFGNILAGYGTDQRYESKLMVNRFSKKIQTSLIASHNNLNQTGISSSDFNTFSLNTSGGGRGGFGGAPVSFGSNNNGLIQGGTVGVNLNADLGKKNTLNSSYYLTQGNTDLKQFTSSENFLPNRLFFTQSDLNSDRNNINHNLSTNLQLNLDSMSQMSLINTITYGVNDRSSSQLDSTLNESRNYLNRNIQNQLQDGTNFNYSGEFNYRRKFKTTGRNFSVDLRYSATNGIDTSNILSEVFDIFNMLNQNTSVFQNQKTENIRNNYSGGINYTEPLSQDLFLTLSASHRNNNNNSDKLFYDLDVETLTIETLNQILSRTFKNEFLYTIGGANLRYKTKKFNANTGLEYQYSNLSGSINNLNSNPVTFAYFLPKASLQFENTNLRFNYNTNVREPSIDQLQPITDNSDPLNIYEGNPALRPEYRHNLSTFYGFFDQFNFRSLFTNLRLSYTKDKITNSTFVEEGFIRRTTPFNTNREMSANLFVSYSSPLNFMKAKFRTGVSSSVVKGINFINNIENDINRWVNNYNLTLENKKKDKIDVSTSLRWSLNQTEYLQNKSLNTSFVNQTYNATFIYYPIKSWTIETKYDLLIFSQTNFAENTKINLIEASISKSFFNDRITAKIKGFDLLNQNTGVNRSAAETYTREVLTNTIGRYYMLSFNYRLSAMGNANSAPTQRRMMFHG